MWKMQTGEASTPRRGFFCGRHGHPLRPHHALLVETLLPALRLDLSAPSPNDLTQLFSSPVEELRLEIGFGGGEHLISEAKRLPDVGFFGCEPYLNGVAKTLAGVARAKLSNLKILPGDAWELLEWLPDGVLNGIYMLYPDPWPKRRHWKRRFVQEDTLAAFARVMHSGAELRFATDVDDYAEWMMLCGSQSSSFICTRQYEDDQRKPWPHFPGTRYEERAKMEGRTPRYLEFRRK